MTQTVSLNIVDQIATITFNRPKAMNSFNMQMAEELAEITTKVRHDTAIRLVVLQGAGDMFMAGGDIHFFHDSFDRLATEVIPATVKHVNTSINNILHMPKPVLACVHGAVAGIGMSYMAAADLVIAADTTQFLLAYSKLGTSPDGGITYTLPRIVGSKKAAELIMLSETFSAAQALSLGLVNWVVAADQLMTEKQRIIQRLANGPTLAYAKTKHLLQEAWHNNLNEQLVKEAQFFAESTLTEDFKSGVTAFVNKNKANFKGA